MFGANLVCLLFFLKEHKDINHLSLPTQILAKDICKDSKYIVAQGRPPTSEVKFMLSVWRLLLDEFLHFSHKSNDTEIVQSILDKMCRSGTKDCVLIKLMNDSGNKKLNVKGFTTD